MNLITDRTQADVAYRNVIRNKIISRTATEEEWDEWNAGLKGAYTYQDLNRVGAAVQELADLLSDYGIEVSVTAKQDWLPTDNPTQTQMHAYIVDIETLRNAVPVAPDTPEVPSVFSDARFATPKITLEQANDIEKILNAVYEATEKFYIAPRYSGITISGVQNL